MKTRKEIKSEIKTTKVNDHYGVKFYHEYLQGNNKYSVSTFPFSPSTEKIEDSSGQCFGDCNTKTEFVDFLYNHLNK